MKKAYILILPLFLILFLSCEKDNPVESQEAQIESYITKKLGKDSTLNSIQQGRIYYLYHSNIIPQVGAEKGDSVYFYYLATLVSDTTKYYDTNHQETAEVLGLTRDPESYGPLGVIVGYNDLIPGLGIGLSMVHLGDDGEIIFNSDYGYGGRDNGIVPANSALIYKIQILRIRKN